MRLEQTRPGEDASCCPEAVHGAAGEPDVPGHGGKGFELPQRWLRQGSSKPAEPDGGCPGHGRTEAEAAVDSGRPFAQGLDMMKTLFARAQRVASNRRGRSQVKFNHYPRDATTVLVEKVLVDHPTKMWGNIYLACIMSTKAFAEALAQKLGLTLTFVYTSDRKDAFTPRAPAEDRSCGH